MHSRLHEAMISRHLFSKGVMEQEREQQRLPQQTFSGIMPTGLQPQYQPSVTTRAINFVRSMTLQGVGLAVVVFALQGALNPGWRPSDWLGGTEGATTTARLNAEREAQTRTAMAMANAQAAAAAQWAIEQETARQQQEAIMRSLAMKQEAANLADFACMSGQAATAMFGRDAAGFAAATSPACGEAARLRGEITTAQAEAARIGSALMQRPSPMPTAYVAAPNAAPPR
jgi:hypothetical protein